MSRIVFAIGLICLFSTEGLAQAGDGAADRLTLKGLTAFHARVYLGAEGIPSLSSAGSSLQTRLELCLRRSGIEVLDDSRAGPTVAFRASVLLARNLSGTEIGYVSQWDFEVRQFVTTLRGATNYVATWITGGLEINSKDALAADLITDIESACAKFSNAWLSVNPKSR